MQVEYRGYWIRESNQPIPFEFYHDSYDGAPDSGDNRCGLANDILEAMEAIDEQIVDSEFCEKQKKIEQILESSDIVWSKYGSETIGELANKIVNTLDNWDHK